MFENLKKQIEKEAQQRKKESLHYIKEGFCTTWSPEQQKKSDNGLKQYSTPHKWEQYTSGAITREKAIEAAFKRREKDIEAQKIEKLHKLTEAEAAADIKTVSISVKWIKSRTWGYNPHADIIINNIYRYSGTASGCGYDKRTAAIGAALNQSNIILKMLYTAKEKALKKAPAKIKNNTDLSNRDFIHYGAGYGVLPYFEGGVGMGSFEGVFNACGLKLAHYSGDDYNDYYFFEKKV